jgi:uncharacterized coiled-coil protein SlyX
MGSVEMTEKISNLFGFVPFLLDGLGLLFAYLMVAPTRSLQKSQLTDRFPVLLPQHAGYLLDLTEKFLCLSGILDKLPRFSISRNPLSPLEAGLNKRQEVLRMHVSFIEEDIERENLVSMTLMPGQELNIREMKLQGRIAELERKELALSSREMELNKKFRAVGNGEPVAVKMVSTGEMSSVLTQMGWPGVGVNMNPGEANHRAQTIDPNREIDFNRRIAELQEDMKRVVGEKEKLSEMNRTLAEHREDVKKVLRVLDELLEKLPNEEVRRFADTEDFRLYEKVLDNYKL